MTEQVLQTEAVSELQPIRPGFFRGWQLLRQSEQNPREHAQYMQGHHGNAVMQKVFGLNVVHLYGADAHRLALVNQGQVFSNKKAWDMVIGRIFPNGLMLRDGDDHRYHRRLMQAGFKNKAMRRYMLEMVPQVERVVADWPLRPDEPVHVYPAIKKMTLDLAATIFLGMDLGEDADRINRAFELAVAASMPKVRLAIPGTLLWRGIRARRYMCEYFMQQVAAKREGSGNDMFSLLCHSTDEEGNRYTDQEVVDHIIFLMMAAHDTTTSTLTSMIYALARHPDWQQRLFQEVGELRVEHLGYDDLEQLEQTEWVMKEALRMYPPLSSLPKLSLRPFEFEGQRIPAGALVITYPIHTHYMEDYWSQPYHFDPQRFSDERGEHKRHPYSWVPFSGGAHMCIGLHFAIMQVKLVMFEMLRRYRWSVPAGYEMPVQQSPISKPRDDLPVYFVRRGES